MSASASASDLQLEDYHDSLDYHKILEKDLTVVDSPKKNKFTTEILDGLTKRKIPISDVGSDRPLNPELSGFKGYQYQQFSDDYVFQSYHRIIQIEFEEEIVLEDAFKNIIIGWSPCISINALIVSSNLLNNCLVEKNNLYYIPFHLHLNNYPIIEFSKTSFLVKNVFEFIINPTIYRSVSSVSCSYFKKLCLNYGCLINNNVKIICDLNPVSSDISVPQVKYIVMKFKDFCLSKKKEIIFVVSSKNKLILKNFYFFIFNADEIFSGCEYKCFSPPHFTYFSDFDEDITHHYKNEFYLLTYD
jgi:hypothetical protein